MVRDLSNQPQQPDLTRVKSRCRSIPAAVFIKPYAVDLFNYWTGKLEAHAIDEDTHTEIILAHVKRRDGMVCSWEPLEVELTGRQGRYLVEVRLPSQDLWWVPLDYLAIRAV